MTSPADITESEVQVEDVLLATERSWRAVFDNSSVGVALTDAAGRFLSVNGAHEKIFGYANDELHSLTWRDLTHPEDLAANELLVNELLEGKRDRYELEKRCFRKSGDLIWVRVNGTVVAGPGGESRLAVIIEDINERKRLGEELEREHRRLRLLLDLYNQFVAKLDLREFFDAVAERLRELEGWEYSTVCMPEPSGERCRIRLLNEQWKGLLQEGVILPINGTMAAATYRDRTPSLSRIQDVQLPPNSPESEQLRELFIAKGFEVVSTLPLIHNGRMLGALGLITRKDYDSARADLGFLKKLANLLAITLNNALRDEEANETRERLASEKNYIEEPIRTEYNWEETVCASSALRNVQRQVETVAPTDSTVLILGETGTGKELVARAIHDRSARRYQAFIKVDCAAIPATIMESELFGHEKGAFTGAIARKLGRLEVADKGTLFLDEVGDLPLELQPKLLRVLQDRVFERVGSNQTRNLDVRIVAATNCDLEKMVDNKEFRSDLYYRLNVFPIEIPPLRERPDDIVPLVRHYVKKYAQRMRKRITTIPPEALETFQRYPWPGNVRELRHFIERAVILSTGSVLDAPLAGLKRFIEKRRMAHKPLFRHRTLEEIERESILEALRESRWVVGGPRGAASKLGLKRTTLASRMEKLGISRQVQ